MSSANDPFIEHIRDLLKAANVDGALGLNVHKLSETVSRLATLEREIQTHGATDERLVEATACIHSLQQGLTTPSLFIDLLRESLAPTSKPSSEPRLGDHAA